MRNIYISDHKPAKTYAKQIDILMNKHRLIVCDREFAKDTLSKVSYYRLSAYGLSLRNPDNNNLYREGTTFEQIYALYRFDSHL